jgi:hypothetical protein
MNKKTMLLSAWCLGGMLLSAAPLPSLAQTPLYGVFEQSVERSTSYSNKFDFREVELRTTFTSPCNGTGCPGQRTINFFGFYDGDGQGAQTGDTWKFRFMPDEVGQWSYAYCWSEDEAPCTPGNSGTFNVVDTGLPGPLKVATDRTWYFMNSRGQPFHWRGYGIHHFLNFTDTGRIATETAELEDVLEERVIGRGYNALMWLQMGDRFRQSAGQGADEWADSWWVDPPSAGQEPDRRRFNIATFRATEEALHLLKDHGVHVFNFATFLTQGNQCIEKTEVFFPKCSLNGTDPFPFEDLQVFLRYFVARFGAFYNFFGWSPTWEWFDIWTPEEVDQIMSYVDEIDPWKRMQTVHDNSFSTFDWLDFSMRQCPGRELKRCNVHGTLQDRSRFSGLDQPPSHGYDDPDPNSSGGIGGPFADNPIIASEDLWESYQGISDDFENWDMPQNRDESRRTAWGSLLAGVMPLYTDYHIWTSAEPPADGAGEADMHLMFDFVYLKTNYRQYQQLNELVSSPSGQTVAAGILGQEYLVYDEDGGGITITLPSATFSKLWYNPATGAEFEEGTVQGNGQQLTIDPPTVLANIDGVLLLKATSPGSGAPTDGLLIHHTYNEGSGTTAGDSSGNGNQGQINGASWDDGETESALLFDGVDDHVSISSNQLGQISTGLTIAAWVYLDASSDVWKTIVSRQVGSTADEHFFLGLNGTQARFFVNTGAGYSDYEVGVDLNQGQWYHLVGVYDGSSTRLYVNGQLGFTRLHSGNFAADSTPLIVGGNVNSSNGPLEERFAGRVDNLRIYTRGVSASEVGLLASEVNAGSGVAITAPALGTVFSPGQTVMATGTGDNLVWGIDRIGDGLGDFASGSGSSITFTVPADSTTSQSIQIKLSGSGGTTDRTYAIGSGGGTVSITTPPLGTIFSPGQTVTATGTGSNLVWGIDRIGDGLGDFASGSGSSITFTVPADSTPSQTIQIKLSGTEGSADRTYAINSSSFTVTIDSVSTSQPYAVAAAQVGALEFIDRNYTITTLSSALAGGTLIQAANDDKFVTANSHLSFTVSAAASIYVAWDSRVVGSPAWLDGSWTLTGEAYVSDGGSVANVYVKNVAAGQVTLGGTLASPAQDPGSGHSHYVVIVKPQ